MVFRYYCLAVSLAAMVSVTSTASTSTVYGRRKHHQTVGSTIHFGQNPADEATATTSEESNASPRNAYQHHSSISPVVSSTVYGHRDPAMMDEPSSADDDESMQWAPSNVGQVATYARGSNEEDSFTVQSAPSRAGALWGNSNKRPGSVARPSGRITFGPSSSSISVGSSYSIGGGGGGSRGSISSLRRSKRSPQMYGQQYQQYPQQQQQYNNYRRSYPPPPSYHSGGYNSQNNQLDFSLVPSSNQYNGGGGYGGGGYGYNQDPDDNCYYHTLVNGDSEMLFRLLLPIRLRGRTIVKKCIQPTPDANDPRYKVLLKGSNQSSFGHLNANIK
ncbi:hypothetical protein TYRP_011357, partial [Tyrophagus putrescentiae]